MQSERVIHRISHEPSSFNGAAYLYSSTSWCALPNRASRKRRFSSSVSEESGMVGLEDDLVEKKAERNELEGIVVEEERLAKMRGRVSIVCDCIPVYVCRVGCPYNDTLFQISLRASLSITPSERVSVPQLKMRPCSPFILLLLTIAAAYVFCSLLSVAVVVATGETSGRFFRGPTSSSKPSTERVITLNSLPVKCVAADGENGSHPFCPVCRCES